MQAYSDPKRASYPHALPNVEVFYHDPKIDGCSDVECDCELGLVPEDCTATAGWYWWVCFPGCLPDSEPFGPFATEAEALADAQSQAD